MAKHTLLSKEFFLPLKNILVDGHCQHTPASTRGRKIYICTPKKPTGKGHGVRVKTKPYQVIFAFLCVPIVVVALLAKSFSPKVAKELLYRAKKKHGVKIIQNKVTTR